MSLLDTIKEAAKRKLAIRFKKKLQAMDPEEIIGLFVIASKETATSIFHDLKKGIPEEKIKVKWMVQT